MASLPPRRIASLQDVPVRTVNSRLNRGLERLRERLGRGDEGDLRAMLAPLLLIAPAFRRSPARSSGTWVAAAAVAVALVAGVRLIVGATHDPATSNAAAPGTDRSGERASVPPRLGEATAAGSTPEARRPADAVEALATEDGRLAGRLLDPLGAPIAGATVEFRPGRLELGTTPQLVPVDDLEPLEPSHAGTDSSGRFAFAMPRTPGHLQVVGEEYASFMAGEVSTDTWEEEHLVIAAPSRTLAGFVHDDRGLPVEGAVVMLRWPRDLVFRFPEPIPNGRPEAWKAVTDASGAWVLEDAPALEGGWLLVFHDAYLPTELDAPLAAADSLSVELTRKGERREAAARASGVVLDVRDRPVVGARVFASTGFTTAAEDGTFALAASVPGERVAFAAYAPGLLPVQGDLAAHPVASDTPLPEVIRLERAAPGLTGRVVDAEGAPRTEVLVWLADPTVVGSDSRLPILAENLIAHGAERLWRRARTDGDGRFDLGSVTDRAYRLRAMDPGTLAWTELDAVRPGEPGVELVLPRAPLRPLEGRVVDDRGFPVAGARVRTTRTVLDLAVPETGGRFPVTHPGPAATTDAGGRFRLDPIAVDGVRLEVTGARVMPREFPLAVDAALELVVSRRAYLRIATDLPEAETFSVLDADGRTLTAVAYLTGSVYPEERVRMRAGSSAIVAVPDTARTVVLYSADAELVRREWTPLPGEVVVVRL